MCSKQCAIGSCILIFGTLLEQIFLLTYYIFLFSLLIYIYICLDIFALKVLMPRVSDELLRQIKLLRDRIMNNDGK